MALTFLLHADDIGLSRGITESILGSIDEGYVRSVSLICNGTAVGEAVRALAERPGVRVSLHLNLLEGPPLSDPAEIPLLVDAEGQLSATFQRLVRLWVQGDDRQRGALREQMRREFSAQLRRGSDALRAAGRPAELLRIDSHTHIHALDFVLDAALDCVVPGEIGYVRLPCEPWHIGGSAGEWRTAIGRNCVKWALLRRLSARMIPKLEARGIGFTPRFLGVLHTGRMTVPAIEAGGAACIASLKGTSWNTGDPIEVLLHPGKADDLEKAQWAARPELWAYYRSANRDLEAATARSIGHCPFFAGHFRSV